MLGPWNGPQATEHVRIPVGQGVCGAAAASGETEIVDDVNADPRYLACFPSTRSEIVVPIAHEGRVVGEIDIDSDRPAAFGEDDRALLERVRAGRRPRSVTRIAPQWHHSVTSTPARGACCSRSFWAAWRPSGSRPR